MHDYSAVLSSVQDLVATVDELRSENVVLQASRQALAQSVHSLTASNRDLKWELKGSQDSLRLAREVSSLCAMRCEPVLMDIRTQELEAYKKAYAKARSEAAQRSTVVAAPSQKANKPMATKKASKGSTRTRTLPARKARSSSARTTRQ